MCLCNLTDWVRLCAGLAPRHWTHKPGEKWDAGYAATAFFLAWLNKRYKADTVRRLNKALNDRKYDEDRTWKEVTGYSIQTLWGAYCEERGVVSGRALWDRTVVYVTANPQ